MLACMVALTGLSVGAWNVSFDEPTGVLSLRNDTRNVSIAGTLSFNSNGEEWSVTDARDAATDRLALVNKQKTVYGYISFRADGDRLSIQTFHRAGAIFYPGKLTFNVEANVNADGFACRTRPDESETVLSFADGAGDSACNDSIFVREKDLALRFDAEKVSVATKSPGAYSVTLVADIEQASKASIVIDADGRYYASRWAPGYHPIDRKRCPKAPTGWMSWNTYFDKATQEDNIFEAQVGKKWLQPFGLDIWSIESWQGNSTWLPVADFNNLDLSLCEGQFTDMKKLADDIKALGFRPGIWMPLYGTGDKAFYEAHRDWFVHDENGKPIPCWNGRYMLDPTCNDAWAHIRKITRIAHEDWGYTFFKFDGMANTPRLFEQPWVRNNFKDPKDPKWFENTVASLREGIGDSILLGCMGDFTGTEAKYLDASRLGADVVGLYRGCAERTANGIKSNYVQYPVRWQNILHQAQCTFSQIFVNNIMFYTDPDTLLVSPVLEKNEAEVMATIIGLPGQLMFAGDKLTELPPERMKIIQQVLPVADIHPQNLYPYYKTLNVWNLTITRPFETWNVIALMNLEDSERDIGVRFEDVGLQSDAQYAMFEFWQQKWMRTSSIAEKVPARSVRLIAVRKALDRPQFVGDDRHITQGAVELEDLRWQNDQLDADVKVIAGFPITLHFAVHGKYDFKTVTAPEGVEVKTKLNEDLLSVTLKSAETKTVTLSLAFTKK